MKRIFHYLPLFLLPAFSIPLAHAQYGFDIGVGFGAMQDKASSKNLDDSLAPCTIGSAEVVLSLLRRGMISPSLMAKNLPALLAP